MQLPPKFWQRSYFCCNSSFFHVMPHIFFHISWSPGCDKLKLWYYIWSLNASKRSKNPFIKFCIEIKVIRFYDSFFSVFFQIIFIKNVCSSLPLRTMKNSFIVVFYVSVKLLTQKIKSATMGELQICGPFLYPYIQYIFTYIVYMFLCIF